MKYFPSQATSFNGSSSQSVTSNGHYNSNGDGLEEGDREAVRHVLLVCLDVSEVARVPDLLTDLVRQGISVAVIASVAVKAAMHSTVLGCIDISESTGFFFFTMGGSDRFMLEKDLIRDPNLLSTICQWSHLLMLFPATLDIMAKVLLDRCETPLLLLIHRFKEKASRQGLDCILCPVMDPPSSPSAAFNKKIGAGEILSQKLGECGWKICPLSSPVPDLVSIIITSSPATVGKVSKRIKVDEEDLKRLMAQFGGGTPIPLDKDNLLFHPSSRTIVGGIPMLAESKGASSSPTSSAKPSPNVVGASYKSSRMPGAKLVISQPDIGVDGLAQQWHLVQQSSRDREIPQKPSYAVKDTFCDDDRFVIEEDSTIHYYNR
eukprot:gene1067-1155_t